MCIFSPTCVSPFSWLEQNFPNLVQTTQDLCLKQHIRIPKREAQVIFISWELLIWGINSLRAGPIVYSFWWTASRCIWACSQNQPVISQSRWTSGSVIWVWFPYVLPYSHWCIFEVTIAEVISLYWNNQISRRFYSNANTIS